MRRYAIVATLLAGCGGSAEMDLGGLPKPLQEHALHVVWSTTYGDRSSPPGIFWVEEACPGHPEWGASIYNGRSCYDGIYYPDYDIAQIAWRGSFSLSAFAHELYHAHQWREDIIDYEHEDPAWGTIVVDANRALSAQGM